MQPVHVLAGILTAVFTSCSKDNDNNNRLNPNDPNVPAGIAVTGISLDKTILVLFVAEDYTLSATITPDSATYQTITWTSSNTKIATIDNAGKVTAITEGKTTITAKAGNKTATCEVEVKSISLFVEINGIKWATRNVGEIGTFVVNPKQDGNHYTWEEAQAVCPTGFRLPTRAEIDKLVNKSKVTNEWTTLDGVRGRRFTDIANGNSIFLPAAGYRFYSGAIEYVGTGGNYWSSTLSDEISAYCLAFGNAGANTEGYFYIGDGQTIRCVAEN
jgi:uncharacterized protein (TIGR02145 family)